MLQGEMFLRIWDVEHGACAMLQHQMAGIGGKVAMIDSGSTASWRPSAYLKYQLGRSTLDYLFITNADQDHMADLQGLADAGIQVRVLHRNPTYSGQELARIKKESGPLTDDAWWYVAACDSFDQPVTEPFAAYMGGTTVTHYYNSYPTFTDTNNLSLVSFISYGSFKILFPGDLEVAGWQALLRDAAFRRELTETTVLVASHHGRRSGFCADVFDYLQPRAVVISDKPIAHTTQLTLPDYRQVVQPHGVVVRTTRKRRRVLTTRRDGYIDFRVDGAGNFFIDTECAG